MTLKRVDNAGFHGDGSSGRIGKGGDVPVAKIASQQVQQEHQISGSSGVFSGLSPEKLTQKVVSFLEKAGKDPKVMEALMGQTISSSNSQVMAFATYGVIKHLFGKKFSLSEEDEKALFEAIKQEYEEDKTDATKILNPDERKKRKKERQKKAKKKVNLIMALIDKSIEKLEQQANVSGRRLDFSL